MLVHAHIRSKVVHATCCCAAPACSRPLCARRLQAEAAACLCACHHWCGTAEDQPIMHCSLGSVTGLLEELLAREHQAGITPDPEVLLGWVALHWAWTAATSPLEVLDCAPTGHSMNRRTATLPSLPSDPFSHLQVDAYMRATSGPSKQNLIVEVIIKLLGLDVCADTGASVVGQVCLVSGGEGRFGWVTDGMRPSSLYRPTCMQFYPHFARLNSHVAPSGAVVGNAMLRGTSGGQKKRVTTGGDDWP